MATLTETILYIHSNSFSRKLKIDTKCYHLSAVTLYPTWQSWKFFIFVISNNKSFISQNLKVVGPLGGKLDFLSTSGFEIQIDFDYRTSKIKFYSVKALKCYVNEKNLIHDRVTEMISKFSFRFLKRLVWWNTADWTCCVMLVDKLSL